MLAHILLYNIITFPPLFYIDLSFTNQNWPIKEPVPKGNACTLLVCVHACAYSTDVVRLNICSLFYLNVNIKAFFHLCHQIIFPIVKSTGFSLLSLYLASHQLSLFRKGALYYIFLQNFVGLSSHCSLNFHSPQVFLQSLPVLFSLSRRQILLPACRTGKHSHNRCASGWREISHRT